MKIPAAAFFAFLSAHPCSAGPPRAAIELSMPLPPASFSLAVPLRHYLTPSPAAVAAEAGPGGPRAVTALLRDGADGAAVSAAVADGTLVVALVEIDVGELRFAGQRVIGLEGFRLPDGALRGNTITPLFDALRPVADAAKRAGGEGTPAPFRGAVLVAQHRSAPYSLIRQVLYTLGQAQFANFGFLVSDPHPAAALPTPTGDRQVVVEIESGDRVSVRAANASSGVVVPIAELDRGLVAALGDARSLGCAVLTSASGARSEQIWAIFDALQARGVQPLLAGVASAPDPDPAPTPATGPVAPQRWDVDDVVPVRRSVTPSLPAAAEASAAECLPGGLVPIGSLLDDGSPTRGATTGGAPQDP